MFVRAGAILPWGGDAEYAAQLAEKPLEIIICPGEDGSFTLYDDAGDGYGYEKGEYARIPMTWKDGAGQLIIGERLGSYPGMPETMCLRVHVSTGDVAEVQYTGKAVTLDVRVSRS